MDKDSQSGSSEAARTAEASGRSIIAQLLHPVQRNVAAIYDSVAGQYDFFAVLWNCIASSEATRHFRALVHQHVQPGALVLDVGTGTGRSLSLVLRETQPRRVIGVDFSTGMLAQVRKKLTDPRVIKPFFAGHFLAKQEQPLHACTMECLHRYEHGLATVVTFGKRCELSAAALLHQNASAVH